MSCKIFSAVIAIAGPALGALQLLNKLFVDKKMIILIAKKATRDIYVVFMLISFCVMFIVVFIWMIVICH